MATVARDRRYGIILGVGLVPKPHAVLTDADVADGLNRACAVIDPLLDLLSTADPIGLRRRSHRLLTSPPDLAMPCADGGCGGIAGPPSRSQHDRLGIGRGGAAAQRC